MFEELGDSDETEIDNDSDALVAYNVATNAYLKMLKSMGISFGNIAFNISSTKDLEFLLHCCVRRLAQLSDATPYEVMSMELALMRESYVASDTDMFTYPGRKPLWVVNSEIQDEYASLVDNLKEGTAIEYYVRNHIKQQNPESIKTTTSEMSLADKRAKASIDHAPHFFDIDN